MTKTLLRFLLLLTLLVLGHVSVRAQSVPERPNHTVTGFGDPEPMDPRYAPVAELNELKDQVQTLMQAYDQLITRYNAQNVKLQQLEQLQPAAPIMTPVGRSRSLRINALSGSY